MGILLNNKMQQGYQQAPGGMNPNYQQQYQQAGWDQQQMQNYGYQNSQQPQGYQFQPTKMDANYLKENKDQVFEMFDRDRSGKLGANEAWAAIAHLYQIQGKYPQQQDIMYAMKQFDDDMSGYLDREEFYRLMKYLSGNLDKGEYDYSKGEKVGRKTDKKQEKTGKEGKDKKGGKGDKEGKDKKEKGDKEGKEKKDKGDKEGKEKKDKGEKEGKDKKDKGEKEGKDK